MASPSRRGRWWVALAYGLAVVVSQGLHVHRGGEGGTADDGAHAVRVGQLDGGASHHGHAKADNCPACHFQLDHLAWFDTPDAPSGVVAGDAAPGPLPVRSCRPLLTTWGRAPPIA